MTPDQEEWSGPTRGKPQGSLRFEPTCPATQAFAPQWAKVAPELNWSPVTCQLAPGHDGRHFDEATGIPWDEA